MNDLYAYRTIILSNLVICKYLKICLIKQFVKFINYLIKPSLVDSESACQTNIFQFLPNVTRYLFP